MQNKNKNSIICFVRLAKMRILIGSFTLYFLKKTEGNVAN